MTPKPLHLLAALSLVGTSGAAIAQTAAPLSLANAPVMAGAEARLSGAAGCATAAGLVPRRESAANRWSGFGVMLASWWRREQAG